MRRIILFLIIVGCFIFASQGAFAGQCPSEGDVFPEIALSVPQQAGEKDYLGIADGMTAWMN